MNFRCVIPAVVVAGLLGFSAPALAHPRLLRTTPAANATIAAPTRITLAFSERLIAPMSAGDLVVIATPNHTKMAPTKIVGVTPGIAGGGKMLVLALKRKLAPGSYRLNWHVVSVDTHRVQGTLNFKVK